MYFLYMESKDEPSENDQMRGLILVKSENIQVLVNKALERDKAQFPDFSIGNEVINFEEDDYILVS